MSDLRYFGTDYFKMPNDLIAGIYNDVATNTKKIKYIPLNNVKEVYPSCGVENFPAETNPYAIGTSQYEVLNNRDSSMFNCDNTTLKGWGSNRLGELGLGQNIKYINSIVNIPIDFKEVKKVFRTKSCRYLYNDSTCFYGTIFIMKDGTVKGCGTNLYGYEGTAQYSIVDLDLTNVKDIFYTNK